jgi:hypothetical protein
MRRKGVLMKILALSILLGVAGILEAPPRIALWKANFSTKTYWVAWPSYSRSVIECSDRNPTNFLWMNYFPNLQELRLDADENNPNHFSSVEPFTAIKKLRKLSLTGVSLQTIDDIPSFPQLEELVFRESNCWKDGDPTDEQLAKLRSRLPNLQKLVIDDDEFESLTWSSTTKRFHFDRKP